MVTIFIFDGMTVKTGRLFKIYFQFIYFVIRVLRLKAHLEILLKSVLLGSQHRRIEPVRRFTK